MTRIIVTDRCTEPGCQCNDTRGIVLYDGPSREDAAEACQNARYPNPTIETTEEGKMTIHEVEAYAATNGLIVRYERYEGGSTRPNDGNYDPITEVVSEWEDNRRAAAHKSD